MRRRVRRVWPVIAVLLAVGGCDSASFPQTAFTISVTGSRTTSPMRFAGTYQYFDRGERVIRDITGDGNFGVSFYADKLVYVRVSATAGEGFYSMRVNRNDEIIFESPATIAGKPIIYSSH